VQEVKSNLATNAKRLEVGVCLVVYFIFKKFIKCYDHTLFINHVWEQSASM
jgi:hypothetical protein